MMASLSKEAFQRWTANPLLPPKEEGGSNGRGRGDVIDYVEVATNLQTGCELLLKLSKQNKMKTNVYIRRPTIVPLTLSSTKKHTSIRAY